MCQIEKFGASPFKCAGTGKNTRASRFTAKSVHWRTWSSRDTDNNEVVYLL